MRLFSLENRGFSRFFAVTLYYARLNVVKAENAPDPDKKRDAVRSAEPSERMARRSERQTGKTRARSERVRDRSDS